MAANANSAYMLWRQFAGEAKVPRAAGLGGLRTTQVAADRTVGPSLGEQVERFASAAAGAFNAHTELQKSETKLSNEKAQAWMARHTPAEWRNLIETNAVPFQDDPVAMGVLHNGMGYNIALKVEEAHQNRIREGKFKTVEEAEKARVEALEGARAEFALTTGIGADNKAFRTGFDRDDVRRRDMAVALQTDVTDKALRTQARIQTTVNLNAPLTKEFVKNADPSLQVSYITNSMKQARERGQLVEADMPQVLDSVLTNLKGLPGGTAVIKALGSSEFTMGGVTASLRDHMGGGAFDQFAIAAAENEFKQSAAEHDALQQTISKHVPNGDSVSLRRILATEVEASGGVETSKIKQIRHAVDAAERVSTIKNAKALADLQEMQESRARLNEGVDMLRRYVNGEIAFMSPNAVDRGAKDSKEGRLQEQALLESYTDPSERMKVAMKLAALDPKGFAGDTLGQAGVIASSQWDTYVDRVGAGDAGAKVPPQVTQMQNLYKQDPLLFGTVFKDQKYLDVLMAAESIGTSVEDVARSSAAWKKLPESARTAAKKELGVQIAKAGGENISYAGESIKQLAGSFMATGVAPEKAIKHAREVFETQVDRINDYPVHKGFFSFDGTSDSYTTGRRVFDMMLPDLMAEAGVLTEKDGIVQYDPLTNSVRVRDLSTGKASQVINAVTLRDRANIEAEKAKAVNDAKVNALINKQQATQRLNEGAAIRNEATKAARSLVDGSVPDAYGPNRVKENPLGLRSESGKIISPTAPVVDEGIFPGNRVKP